MKGIGFLMFALAFFTLSHAQVLLKGPVHLRHGVTREWVTFPEHAKDSALSLTFTANDPASRMISLVQFDVTHVWNVSLNGKAIGTLTQDEQNMTTDFSLAPGILRKGKNTLTIQPAPGSISMSDDINISNITLYRTVPPQSQVFVSVFSEGQPVPSRLTIVNANRSLQPVGEKSDDTLAIRTGVIYSGTGNYLFTLPAGTYTLYASRGFEYGVDSALISIKAGEQLKLNMNLVHEVNTGAWKSVDTHVHTKEFSGHGDATMSERILSIAGEGLDYAVITEHNKAVSISDMVQNKRMDKWFTPITGDELTTTVGHFNLFPIAVDSVPSPGGITWHHVASIKKNGKQVVILNHARDEHNGFRPSDTMFTVAANGFPANAMEIMNSGSQQTNPRELYMDWMRLMSKGIFLAAIGSSDSHDVSRFIVGQSRTYVSSEGNLINNFLSRKTRVSFGLLSELQVDTISRERAHVIVKVKAPSWIKPTKFSLYVNGQVIYTSAVTDKDKQVGNFYQQELKISLPPKQVIIIAVAEGPDPKVPWWPINRPYQHTLPDLDPVVLGVSDPIIIE